MFRIAVCDDDLSTVKRLQEYLLELNVLGTPVKVQAFTQGIKLCESYAAGKRYDLLVLDMMMRRQDGLTTAAKLRKYDENVPIMIVSSSRDFAVEGYNVRAAAYFVKPVDKYIFLKRAQKILQELTSSQAESFKLKAGKIVQKVKLQDIYYFEAAGRKVKVQGKSICQLIDYHLYEVEENLLTKGFVKPHQSFVVNMAYLQRIEGDRVIMENNHEVPLSKRNCKKIKQEFSSYLESRL